jgi:glucosamine-6-phosphate deaminase
MDIKTSNNLSINNLSVRIYENRRILGKAAADNVAEKINYILSKKSEVRIIFAAAPSQNEFLEMLIQKHVDWSKVTAFHMDEYLGLNKKSPQLFSKYLNAKIFDKISFKKINLIEPFENASDECKRYESLLREKPIDIVCMGIGENGHLAFNDPPVADFNDYKWVKIVTLDQQCRQQQVNDGCFALIDDVPIEAITLTIPALMSAKYISVVVPGIRKAAAVMKTFYEPISSECPSTTLRTHSNTVIYLDNYSASEFIKN